jgi:hypothetical protein
MTAASATSPTASAVRAGQSPRPGQSLTSPNGQFTSVMPADGNLVKDANDHGAVGSQDGTGRA